MALVPRLTAGNFYFVRVARLRGPFSSFNFQRKADWVLWVTNEIPAAMCLSLSAGVAMILQPKYGIGALQLCYEE